MPAKYEAIRDKLMAAGATRREAEGHAARIYNAQRPRGAAPVGPTFDRRGKAKT